jgi:hypothetical protein
MRPKEQELWPARNMKSWPSTTKQVRMCPFRLTIAPGENYIGPGIDLLETELSSQMSVKNVLFQKVPAETINLANTMHDSIVLTGRLAFMRAR